MTAFPNVSVHNKDGLVAGVSITQDPELSHGLSAHGLPALSVAQVDSTGPVIKGQGGGTLLTLRNAVAAEKFGVDNSGNVTAGGNVTVGGKISGLANGAAATDAAALGQVLSLQATTGVTGYTLVNGTGNIITWTAPDDGLLHRYQLFAQVIVTVNMTAGELAIDFKAVDGTSELQQLFAGDATTGVYGVASFSWISGLVQAGQAVTLSQFTALTGGAAKFWCEIWGS